MLSSEIGLPDGRLNWTNAGKNTLAAIKGLGGKGGAENGALRDSSERSILLRVGPAKSPYVFRRNWQLRGESAK